MKKKEKNGENVSTVDVFVTLVTGCTFVNNRLTRLISIVAKPIKLICGQTNFDEKI